MERSADSLFLTTTLRAPVRRIAAPTLEFDTFFRSEFASMVALARTICGSHEVAEDVAQEAMSRAHRDWSKISGYEKPGAWLRRVTINLAISRRRRITRELRALRRSTVREFVVDAHDPTGEHEVWAAVRKLPPRQRAVVALFYQEDLSTSEIAHILECSVSTATSHLSAARRTLAGLLGEPEPGELS